MKASKFLLLVYFAIAGFGQLFAAPVPRLMKPIRQLARPIPSLFTLSTRYNTDVNSRTVAAISAIEAAAALASAAPQHALGALELLRSLIKDEEGFVRRRTANALVVLASAAPKQAAAALELLRCLAQDQDDFVRRGTGEALAKLASEVIPTQPFVALELLRLLAKDSDIVHQHSSKAVAERAKAAPEQAPALLELLKSLSGDADKFVRQYAAEALAELASAAPEHAPAILEVLRLLAGDEDELVRLGTLEAVHKFARVARQHAPTLLRPEAFAEGQEEIVYAYTSLGLTKKIQMPAVTGLIGGYGSYNAQTGALNLSGFRRYDVILENSLADQIPSQKTFAVRDVITLLETYKERLRTIDLSYNLIGICGATKIITFANEHLPNLQELNLQNNRIDPVEYFMHDFVQASRALLKKAGFKRLNLHNNHVIYTHHYWLDLVFNSAEAINSNPSKLPTVHEQERQKACAKEQEEGGYPYTIPEPATKDLIESYYDADTQTLGLSCRKAGYEIAVAERKRNFTVYAAGAVKKPKCFTVKQIIAVLKKHKRHIRTIDLGNNFIGMLGATELINFANDNLHELQELNLEANAITPMPDSVEADFVTAAQNLVEKDKFKKLNLDDNNICLRWRSFVSRHGGCTALTSEKVLWSEWREEEQELQEPEAKGLIESYYDVDTQTLDLSCRKAGYKIVLAESQSNFIVHVAGAIKKPKCFTVKQVIAVLKKHKRHIRTIDLGNNFISMLGATELINFANDNLHELQELNLEANVIAPIANSVEADFVTAVQNLVKKDKFKKLNLGKNIISLRWTSFVERYAKATRTVLTSEKVLWSEWWEEENGSCRSVYNDDHLYNEPRSLCLPSSF